MPKVLIADKMSPSAMEVFKNRGVDVDVITGLTKDEQSAFAKSIVKLLGDENVALDFGAYRTAPAGFRVWASGLIEKSDLEACLLYTSPSPRDKRQSRMPSSA